MTKPVTDIWRSEPEPWIEPTSVDDALTRRDALLERIKGIDVQLGDRGKRVAGSRLGNKDYWSWRTKALWARHHLEADAAKLKRWARDRRVPVATGDLDSDEKLLVAAAKAMKGVLVDIANAGVKCTVLLEYQRTLDAIEMRLGLR
jgi:hypothetical protein